MIGQNLVDAQNPDFFKEDLTFTLSDSSFSVSGYYYFHNNTQLEIKTNLLYPFPVDETKYGPISEVYAYQDGDPTLDVLVKYNDKTGLVRVDILPDEWTKILIGYTQKVLGDQVEYILTTTQAWGEPFAEADYTLIVPDEITIDSISYQPDLIKKDSGQRIYYFHRENFMPDREFEVYFGRQAMGGRR